MTPRERENQILIERINEFARMIVEYVENTEKLIQYHESTSATFAREIDRLQKREEASHLSDRMVS